MSSLRESYLWFTSGGASGARNAPEPKMDAFHFFKLCKECGLQNKNVTPTKLALVFNKVRNPRERRVTFVEFRDGLIPELSTVSGMSCETVEEAILLNTPQKPTAPSRGRQPSVAARGKKDESPKQHQQPSGLNTSGTVDTIMARRKPSQPKKPMPPNRRRASQLDDPKPRPVPSRYYAEKAQKLDETMRQRLAEEQRLLQLDHQQFPHELLVIADRMLRTTASVVSAEKEQPDLSIVRRVEESCRQLIHSASNVSSDEPQKEDAVEQPTVSKAKPKTCEEMLGSMSVALRTVQDAYGLVNEHERISEESGQELVVDNDQFSEGNIAALVKDLMRICSDEAVAILKHVAANHSTNAEDGQFSGGLAGSSSMSLMADAHDPLTSTENIASTKGLRAVSAAEVASHESSLAAWLLVDLPELDADAKSASRQHGIAVARAAARMSMFQFLPSSHPAVAAVGSLVVKIRDELRTMMTREDLRKLDPMLPSGVSREKLLGEYEVQFRRIQRCVFDAFVAISLMADEPLCDECHVTDLLNSIGTANTEDALKRLCVHLRETAMRHEGKENELENDVVATTDTLKGSDDEADVASNDPTTEDVGSSLGFGFRGMTSSLPEATGSSRARLFETIEWALSLLPSSPRSIGAFTSTTHRISSTKGVLTVQPYQALRMPPRAGSVGLRSSPVLMTVSAQDVSFVIPDIVEGVVMTMCDRRCAQRGIAPAALQPGGVTANLGYPTACFVGESPIDKTGGVKVSHEMAVQLNVSILRASPEAVEAVRHHELLAFPPFVEGLSKALRPSVDQPPSVWLQAPSIFRSLVTGTSGSGKSFQLRRLYVAVDAAGGLPVFVDGRAFRRYSIATQNDSSKEPLTFLDFLASCEGGLWMDKGFSSDTSSVPRPVVLIVDAFESLWSVPEARGEVHEILLSAADRGVLSAGPLRHVNLAGVVVSCRNEARNAAVETIGGLSRPHAADLVVFDANTDGELKADEACRAAVQGIVDEQLAQPEREALIAKLMDEIDLFSDEVKATPGALRLLAQCYASFPEATDRSLKIRNVLASPGPGEEQPFNPAPPPLSLTEVLNLFCDAALGGSTSETRASLLGGAYSTLSCGHLAPSTAAAAIPRCLITSIAPSDGAFVTSSLVEDHLVASAVVADMVTSEMTLQRTGPLPAMVLKRIASLLAEGLQQQAQAFLERLIGGPAASLMPAASANAQALFRLMNGEPLEVTAPPPWTPRTPPPPPRSSSTPPHCLKSMLVQCVAPSLLRADLPGLSAVATMLDVEWREPEPTSRSEPIASGGILESLVSSGVVDGSQPLLLGLIESLTVATRPITLESVYDLVGGTVSSYPGLAAAIAAKEPHQEPLLNVVIALAKTDTPMLRHVAGLPPIPASRESSNRTASTFTRGSPSASWTGIDDPPMAFARTISTQGNESAGAADTPMDSITAPFWKAPGGTPLAPEQRTREPTPIDDVESKPNEEEVVDEEPPPSTTDAGGQVEEEAPEEDGKDEDEAEEEFKEGSEESAEEEEAAETSSSASSDGNHKQSTEEAQEDAEDEAEESGEDEAEESAEEAEEGEEEHAKAEAEEATEAEEEDEEDASPEEDDASKESSTAEEEEEADDEQDEEEGSEEPTGTADGNEEEDAKDSADAPVGPAAERSDVQTPGVRIAALLGSSSATLHRNLNFNDAEACLDDLKQSLLLALLGTPEAAAPESALSSDAAVVTPPAFVEMEDGSRVDVRALKPRALALIVSDSNKTDAADANDVDSATSGVEHFILTLRHRVDCLKRGEIINVGIRPLMAESSLHRMVTVECLPVRSDEQAPQRKLSFGASGRRDTGERVRIPFGFNNASPTGVFEILRDALKLHLGLKGGDTVLIETQQLWDGEADADSWTHFDGDDELFSLLRRSVAQKRPLVIRTHLMQSASSQSTAPAVPKVQRASVAK